MTLYGKVESIVEAFIAGVGGGLALLGAASFFTEIPLYRVAYVSIVSGIVLSCYQFSKSKKR